jgi:hypothetical protein
LRRWFGRSSSGGRSVECAVCGEELDVAEAVIIYGSPSFDRDAGAVTVAEYHRGCLTDPPPDS